MQIITQSIQWWAHKSVKFDHSSNNLSWDIMLINEAMSGRKKE